MNAKEKAIYLYGDIYDKLPSMLKEVYLYTSAKSISVYMVNEIIKTFDEKMDKEIIKEWQEIKQELIKL